MHLGPPWVQIEGSVCGCVCVSMCVCGRGRVKGQQSKVELLLCTCCEPVGQ